MKPFDSLTGLKSDVFPCNEKSPLRTVLSVCRDFEGDGICSVGANSALQAMATHWNTHLAEGCSLKIISEDIDALRDLLEVMRAEIMTRLLALPEPNRVPDQALLRESDSENPYLVAARDAVGNDDDLKVYDDATVDQVDSGAWVSAWLWVSNEAIVSME